MSVRTMISGGQSRTHLSPAVTVISLYALISLSLIQALGVPYMLLSGYSDIFLIAGEVLIAAGVSLLRHYWVGPLALANRTVIQSTFSLILVAFHLIIRRKFSRYDGIQCQKSSLASAYAIISSLVFTIWLAAGAIGLVTASRLTICARNTLHTRPWNNIDICKLQQASIAMSLLSM